MRIDHIFIFTTTQGTVADELIDFGFTEGSSRVHPGQGTVNRKFYFKNFFLEVLWVNEPNEINSELIRRSQLNERANYTLNGYSPFGLCMVNTEDTQLLFSNAIDYQPLYFPAGLAIKVLPNADQPTLPWTFRLPFPPKDKVIDNEPIVHQNGIEELTSACFEYTGKGGEEFVAHFINEQQVSFMPSNRVQLVLTFDQGRQGKQWISEKLMLTINY